MARAGEYLKKFSFDDVTKNKDLNAFALFPDGEFF